MNIICIPIDENLGLLSRVAARFCEAPNFLLVETDTLTFRAIPNPRGLGCDPRVLLRGAMVDVFIVSDAGADTLRDPPPLDAPVYRAPAGSVADAIAALIAGRLRLAGPSGTAEGG